MVTIQLVTEKWSPDSALIRWFTWSHRSHVDFVLPAGLLLPDGSVTKGGELLGARLGKSKAAHAGVQVRPANYRHFSNVLVAAIDGPESIYQTAIEQIGKPYDWRAILNFGLHGRDWRVDDAWFCSELVAWCCEQNGVYLLNPHMQVDRVTPRDIEMSAQVKY